MATPQPSNDVSSDVPLNPVIDTPSTAVTTPPPDNPTLVDKLRRALIGAPRNLRDTNLFHTISLIPFLAWVGLGADGLSSSAYGPEEAFKTLGHHTYLAVALALMTAVT